jgi:hypothetical protein
MKDNDHVLLRVPMICQTVCQTAARGQTVDDDQMLPRLDWICPGSIQDPVCPVDRILVDVQWIGSEVGSRPVRPVSTLRLTR